MIPSELTILCWGQPGQQDVRLVKLAEYLGVKVRIVCVQDCSLSESFLGRAGCRRPACLAVSGGF